MERQSMLDDPRGVLVICTCAEDAVELERILSDHGIHDWPGTLEERYNMCIKQYPDDVCFKEYAAGEEDEDFSNHVKCTFYGVNTPDFETATDTELLTLFGI